MRVGPEQELRMTWKVQGWIIGFVVAAALGYAALKFEQSAQGKHLDTIDSRQTDIERRLSAQDLILYRMDGKLDYIAGGRRGDPPTRNDGK